MTLQEAKQRLQQIAENNAVQLTASDKQMIREAAAAVGIEFEPKSRCTSCYRDVAVQILVALKQFEAPADTEPTDGRRYILRPGVDLLFGDIRVNEATMNDALAEKIIARGFNKKYFAKCE